MNRYRIKYHDPDPGCPVFSCIIRAYDQEHALELFFDDGDDWIVDSVTLVK